MKSLLVIPCAVLALLCWAGTGQAWDYYYAPVEADTYFVTANGDTVGSGITPWLPSSVDSAVWQCVNEVAENSTDYVYNSSTTNKSVFFNTVIDTTITYDSLRIVAYATHTTTGTKTLSFRADTSASTNTFAVGPDFESGESGAYVASISNSIDNLSDAALAHLQIGFFNVDDPTALNNIRVDWCFVIAYRPAVIPDSLHIVFDDTVDFRVFQMAEARGGDDKWTLAACTTGAVGDSEYVVGAWVSKDSIVHCVIPSSGATASNIDSAFLHVAFTGKTGNVYSYNLFNVLADESDDKHNPSNANDVTTRPQHMEWNNRVSFAQWVDTGTATANTGIAYSYNFPVDSNLAWRCVNQIGYNSEYVYVDSTVQDAVGIDAETWVEMGEVDTTAWDHLDTVYVDFKMGYNDATSGEPVDSILVALGYDKIGSLVWADSQYVVSASWITYSIGPFTGWTNADLDSLNAGFEVLQQMYPSGGSSPKLSCTYIGVRALVRNDSIPWTTAGAKDWGTDVEVASADTTSSVDVLFDVSDDIRNMMNCGVSGCAGPSWVIRPLNADTTGSHYYKIGGGQPFATTDSTWLEVFFNEDNSWTASGEQLAGYTFGNTAYGTPSSAYTADKIQMGKFNFADGGDVLSITARINPGAVGRPFKFLLYSDNAGSPGSLIACTEEGSGGRSAVYYAELMFATPQTLAAGDYWLGIWADGTGSQFLYYYNATGGTSREDISEAYTGDCGTLSPTWAAEGTKQLLILATYRKSTSAEIFGAHGGFTLDHYIRTNTTTPAYANRNNGMTASGIMGLVSGNTYYVLDKIRELDRIVPAGATIDTIILSHWIGTNTTDTDSAAVFRVFKPMYEGSGVGTANADTNNGAGWYDYMNSSSDATDAIWTTAGCGSADDGGADNTGDGTGADRKATPECISTITTAGVRVNFPISAALGQDWYDGTAAENGVIIRDISTPPGNNTIRSGEFATNLDQMPRWRIVWTNGAAPEGGINPRRRKLIIGTAEEDSCVTFSQSSPLPSWDAETQTQYRQRWQSVLQQ